MKINKNLIILSLLLIFCISLGAVSATDNKDNVIIDDVSIYNKDINGIEINTVSTTDNEGEINELSADSGNFADLQRDINQVQRGTFCLTKDYKFGNGDKGGILINRSLTIDGQGHTIYGNGNQVFNIICEDDFTFTIENLNFVNCSSYKGGAIYFNDNFKQRACVKNCSFVNCSAKTRGGAIYFNKKSFVYGCSFVNCSAGMYGGAIFFPSVDYGAGQVLRCIFVNCSAKYDSAVYNMEDVSVDGCIFVNCKGIPDSNCSVPVFKPKVILTVDDVKEVSGSTVKDMENCGIPLIALLFALITLPILRRK